MSNELTKSIGELNHSAKQYFQTKVDLIKISLLEKTTKMSTSLLTFFVVAMILIWILVFIAAAFAAWYGKTYDNYFQGILIAAGGLLVLAILFLLFRKQIITPPLLRNYSEILLGDEDN